MFHLSLVPTWTYPSYISVILFLSLSLSISLDIVSSFAVVDSLSSMCSLILVSWSSLLVPFPHWWSCLYSWFQWIGNKLRLSNMSSTQTYLWGFCTSNSLLEISTSASEQHLKLNVTNVESIISPTPSRSLLLVAMSLSSWPGHTPASLHLVSWPSSPASTCSVQCHVVSHLLLLCLTLSGHYSDSLLTGLHASRLALSNVLNIIGRSVSISSLLQMLIVLLCLRAQSSLHTHFWWSLSLYINWAPATRTLRSWPQPQAPVLANSCPSFKTWGPFWESSLIFPSPP